MLPRLPQFDVFSQPHALACGFLALGCILPAPVGAQSLQSPLYPLEMGSLSSAASVEDATALLVNPAAMAFMRGSEVYLSRSLAGPGESTNLLMAGPAFATAWQQLRSQGRFLNAFSTGAGLSLGYGLALGGRLGYLQFLDAQGGNAPDLGLSLLFRPTPWFSGGLSIDHLTNPAIGAGSLARRYRLGLATRPLGSRLTLNADMAWQEGSPLNQAEPWLGVVAEPFPGLWLRGAVNLRGEASVGAGVAFGHLASGLMVSAPGTLGAVGGQSVAFVRTTELLAPRSLSLAPTGLAYFRLEGEVVAPPALLSMGESPQAGVLETTQAIARAARDPKVTGVVLDLRGLSLGLARIQELREAMALVKAAKKQSLVYLSDANLGAYYLACSADTIVMHPGGQLDIKGFSRTNYYLKGLLDRLGIRPQFVGIGRYKSAPESFERTQASPASREQDEALLEAMYQQVVSAIATARRRNLAEVRASIDRAVLSPPKARELGLIDHVAYPDEVPELAKAPGAWAYRAEAPRPDTWGKPDVLALVVLAGAMNRGESGGNLLQGDSVGASTIVRTLRALREDEHVKAVVLRVESPGGDALAADEIGRELDLLRLRGKAVIISMGDVAASGGYWVAANGTRIFALPGSITGSIGVFSGYFATGDLMAKLGVTPETIQRGAHADMDAGVRLRSESELDMLRDQARHTYGQFLNRVAKGRNLALTRVDAMAQGRVWIGQQAKELGLVDELGGLEAALAEARRLGKLDEANSVLEIYPKAQAPWTMMQESGMEGQLRRTATTMQRLATPHTWLLAPSLPRLAGP